MLAGGKQNIWRQVGKKMFNWLLCFTLEFWTMGEDFEMEWEWGRGRGGCQKWLQCGLASTIERVMPMIELKATNRSHQIWCRIAGTRGEMWSEAKQRDWPEAGRDPGPFSGRRRKTGGRVHALKVCNVGSHKHYFYVYLYGLHYWWQIERNKWIALLFFFLQLKFFRKLRLCQWDQESFILPTKPARHPEICECF